MMFDPQVATLVVACITAVGVVVAAWVGLHNKGALSQITVNTDGQLANLMTEIRAFKAEISELKAVAAANKVSTDKAALIAAGKPS
jgi:uncharacterized protein YdbL (DUF1318 family)